LGTEIVTSLNIEEWGKFVLEQPGGNIFHTPQMMEVFKRTKGFEPRVYAALSSQGDILSLILSVKIHTLSRLLGKFNTRTVCFGGILFSNNHHQEADAIGKLIRSCNEFNEKGALFTEIRNLTDTSAIMETLVTHGFLYEEYLNYLINLDQPEAAIWKIITRQHRQCIKKSETFGVHVREIKERDEIATFYHMIQKTYSRVKVPGPDSTLFEATFDVLVPIGMAKLLLAIKDDIPIGAAALLLYKDSVYVWYLGSDEAYFKLYPNHILVWESIKIGKKKGLRFLDFLGAGRPSEEYGVRNFKSRFGGPLTNFGRYYKIHSRLALNLSKGAYELYRKF